MTTITNYRNFTLGDFTIYTGEFCIESRDGEKYNLPAKSIEVLSYLASHYPRVIPREELIKHIWQGNTLVGEKSLTNAVWSIRKSFSSDTKAKHYIATIRKGGYKLKVEPKYQQRPQKQLITPEQLTTKLNNISPQHWFTMLLLVVLFTAAIMTPVITTKLLPLVTSVENHSNDIDEKHPHTIVADNQRPPSINWQQDNLAKS